MFILQPTLPIGLDPEDFEENSVPTDQPSSGEGDDAWILSNDSSQVIEGQLEDWDEWELDSEDLDVTPSSGAVRFDGTDQFHEVEVSSDSPMIRYGPLPEMRIHSMIRMYMRPRGRGTFGKYDITS